MPWGSVRGHDALVDDLRSRLALDRLPHAFLFVGPEGVGKHKFARRLAQALLCETNPADSLDPCEKCPACLQVEAGHHPDLIQAGKPADKHELPIEVIRQLCGELALRPMRGGRRIAIVDDADDLNEEASNAFLKTLEEPPPGSILILLGTTPEAQLDTVVSRCRVLRFDPLPERELVHILLEQNAATDAEDAVRLAQLGEGSVQRALALGQPELERFRRTLIDHIANTQPFEAPEMAAMIDAFVKEAGSESVVQRQRANVIIGELARFFRCVLWETSGQQAPSPDLADRQAAERLAERLEPEDVFLLAERCLEASYHVGRRLYLPLIFNALTADLGRIIDQAASRGAEAR